MKGCPKGLSRELFRVPSSSAIVSTGSRDALAAPLWLTGLERAIRLDDEVEFRRYLPRTPPHTLPPRLFRDVSPLRAVFERERPEWREAVLAVACEAEKAHALVALFTPDRLAHHPFYHAIWKATDKGVLLAAAMESPLDDSFFDVLLSHVRQLPHSTYNQACHAAIVQRRPHALQALVTWSRRSPAEDVVTAAFRTHDLQVQQALLSRLSDFGLSGAVDEAAEQGDLPGLDQIVAEMQRRALPDAQQRRHLAKALKVALEEGNVDLWRWALPRADLNHPKGQPLRTAVEEGRTAWAAELLAHGARPTLAIGPWRDSGRWDLVHTLAKQVTAKQRAPWIHQHPGPMAPIQAWEREQRSLARPLPASTRARLRT